MSEGCWLEVRRGGVLVGPLSYARTFYLSPVRRGEDRPGRGREGGRGGRGALAGAGEGRPGHEALFDRRAAGGV